MVSRLLVIDGHSLAFRAFFALPVENFSTRDGQPTNAIYGFMSMLSQVITEVKPTHISVAFDVKGGTFRNELLPQYKGKREATPPEIISQIPVLHEVLTALGITTVEKQGFEGDDIIATLATRASSEDFDVYIFSGDRDSFQLITDQVTVLYPGFHFQDLKHMTPEAVYEKYKVTPAQYPDLAALCGETADNIPGVPGVGPGFASKWIAQFGSLDEILNHADSIMGKKGEALRENIDQVRLNRRVNALVRDVELDVNIADLVIPMPDISRIDSALSIVDFGKSTKERVYSALVAAAEENGISTDGLHAVGEQSDTLVEHMLENLDLTIVADGTAPATASDIIRIWFEQCVRRSNGMENHMPYPWSVYVDHVGTSYRARATRVTCAHESGATLTIDYSILEFPEVASCLSEQIVAHAHSVAVHNYKEILHALKGALRPETFDGLHMDTQLAAYMVVPDGDDYALDVLIRQDLKVSLEHNASDQEVNVQGTLEFDIDSSDDLVQTDSYEQFAFEAQKDSRLALCIIALAKFYDYQLGTQEQKNLLRSVEIPVSRVLYAMESQGANVDIDRLTSMFEMFKADAEQAESIALEQAGQEVNIQSPKQLQKILFEDMQLPPTKKTKKGGYTTNAAALQELYIRSVHNQRAQTFLGALLRHREINKLKQIVQTLREAVDTKDYRIHSTFEQTVAATGRLSSTDPNLQNIPNRNAMGREIRSAFVPTEGYEGLLSADYSQVELRLMAHLSGDQALIEAFNSGIDLHKYVASLVYGVPVEDITGDQRSHIKAMSYGLAYGLSTYGLAQQLKISPAESDLLKQKYFSTFGKVHDYLESLVLEAKKRGYTETMFGRRRYFPDLIASSRQAREAAERGALNAPIQGSAADIMKMAMIRAYDALSEARVRSRIILQIHDELVVDIAPGETELVTAIVRDAMEHVVQLAVPLEVSTGVGTDWQQAAH